MKKLGFGLASSLSDSFDFLNGNGILFYDVFRPLGPGVYDRFLFKAMFFPKGSSSEGSEL